LQKFSNNPGSYNFNGDGQIGFTDSDPKFSNLSVTGYENTIDSASDVTINLEAMPHGTQSYQTKFTNVDGASMVAHDEDFGPGRAIVYTATPYDHTLMGVALWEDFNDPIRLSDGDSGVEISDINSPHDWLVWPNEGGKDRLDVDPSEWRYSDDWSVQLASGRPTLLGTQLNTEYSHDVALFQVGTVPEGAFTGNVACFVKAERDVSWKVYARAAGEGQEFLLAALNALPLTWKGINFGGLIADLTAINTEEGEAKTGVAAAMSYAMPGQTEVVVNGQVVPLNQATTVYHAPQNSQPTGDVAVADSSILGPDETVKMSNSGQFAQYANAIVFNVGASQITELPLWTKCASQVKRDEFNDTAYGWVEATSVELSAPADPAGTGIHSDDAPYRIWELGG